jgi:alkanesulfonate monooxygenase SsuD/methylene tetrahydromethanopterin reductase-like flavin-dependent oxidoreductase (luciferase family)
MKFGLTLPNCGLGNDPAVFVDLAHEAESAGWDGVFIWDSIEPEQGLAPDPTDPLLAATHDTWSVLAAIAGTTNRLRIGPMITPVPRRRPWKLARECVTVDRLSRGRLTLSVGLGDLREGGFAKVGEEISIRVRAERLDEGLAIISGLWTGKPVSYSGQHFRIDELCALPPPLQDPRIPIWVVGVLGKERSVARALRWDGIVIQSAEPTDDTLPSEISKLATQGFATRRGGPMFDIIVGGLTAGDEAAMRVMRSCEGAGATWWLEAMWNHVRDHPGDPDPLRGWIRRGPPS